MPFGQRYLLRSLGQSSEVEHNPKMNILFFNDLGGLFHFFVFWSTFFCSDFLLRLLGRSSEVECNPKTNILFFDDLGGLFHFFLFWSTLFAQITQPKNEHFIFQWLRGPSPFFCISVESFCSVIQKHNPKTKILFFDDLGGLFHFFAQILVNIIQKQTFYFLLRSLSAGWSSSSEVECKLNKTNIPNYLPKTKILFFDDLGAFFIFLHFGQHFLLRSLGRSSEVECNPKTNILFFNDLGGFFHFFVLRSIFLLRCYLLRSLGRSSEVEHNPKNKHFIFQWPRGPFSFFCVLVNIFLLRLLGRSSEVECNPKTNILFFDDLGGLFHFFLFWSTLFAQITRPIIRSWT